MVERWSVGSPAQSASENGPGVKLMPWVKVPLTYLRTCLGASRWAEVGLLMNWQSWWTLKASFGLVKVRYWRAPTILLYLVGSVKAIPSWGLRKQPCWRAARSFGRLRILHVESMRNIKGIFGLCESKAKLCMSNLNIQEIAEWPQILQFKSLT